MHLHRTRRLALLALLSFAFAGVAQAQVVISQSYGGGGNSGATYKNDFIELRNNGSSAVDLSTWSVQYASSTGSSWQVTALSGSIAPGGYYLIQENAGAGGTTDLPTPDAIGSISMAGSSGKVALVSSQTALSGACPSSASFVDLVGMGSSASCFEGSGPAPAPSNTTADLRKNDGAQDTNDNAADFATGAPNPRNSGSTPPPPPPPPTSATIPQIQGSGLLSSYAGQNVVTEGVVTAQRFNNGFFIQATPGDGDPATSDGIFVFTSTAPPAAAAVGNLVRVTGKVEEYTPSSNPNQLSITEITGPTIELLATGQALPAPVELTAADLGVLTTPSTLEPLEGMRVSVANAVVTGPSGGSIDEANATATGNGVFYVQLPGVDRAFREPGIDVLDVTPIPPGKTPPVFDNNNQRLMVRSWGQVGSTAINVDDGASVDGLVGVLDYNSATWALLPDAGTPPTVGGGMAPLPVSDAPFNTATISSFNLQRFFDDAADGNGAPTLTTTAMNTRIAKATLAICDYLKAPDILGTVEVENLRILGLLADSLNSNCASQPQYVPYLVQGNDVGGINVGFLVNTKAVGANPRVEVLSVTQYGKDTTITNPNSSTSILNDRPPLVLDAVIHADNGGAWPVTVVVNHLRSLNGINSTAPGSNGYATEGDRVRVKRAEQALYLANLVEQLRSGNPAQHLVLVGDFNAFEFNDGYADVMGIVEGSEAAEDQVLEYRASPITAPLTNGNSLIGNPDERYSYSFSGNLQTLDHAVLSQSVLDGSHGVAVEHARISADFAVDNYGDGSIPVRLSDHDPVRVTVAVPAFESADLAVSASTTASPVDAGTTAGYSATVQNLGPSPATSPAVALVLDALVTPVVTAAAGWTCDAPVQNAGTTTVTCSRSAALDVNESASFDVSVATTTAMGGSTLSLTASASSQVADPANGNDNASAAVVINSVAPQADLRLSAFSNTGKLAHGKLRPLTLVLGNLGPDAADAAQFVLTGNVAPSQLSLLAPSGWSCSKSATPGGFSVTCTAQSTLASGTSTSFAMSFRMAANAPLSLQATASSSTGDPDGGNNGFGYGVTRKAPAPARALPHLRAGTAAH
jgi:predicted extracellular nuclease